MSEQKDSVHLTRASGVCTVPGGEISAPRRLIRDMSFLEVRAAEDASSGRSWALADFAAVTAFSDCARAEFYWADGAAVYMLHDSKEEAVAHLSDLGFGLSATPSPLPSALD